MAKDDHKKPMATQAIEVEGGSSLSLQRYSLVQVQGPQPGQVRKLESERTVVGKSPQADVSITDLTVSRQHFEIRNENGRYWIKDLGSTNGTELDGARIREAFLRPGSTIKAGEVVFRFQTEYDAVHIQPSQEDSFGSMRGRSLRMREIFAMLGKVSQTDSTILLLGPTGTGKGAAAQAIHEASPRRSGPLVVVDCGAVARNLIESELFGHVKGAFTGAAGQRRGALEESQGGTLFLDELDDLPLDLQPKLLRALEERVFVRLGSNKPIPFDARVIAASKKDLRKEVAGGRFREDLYYRLSVVNVRLPALRERLEDIPLLVDHFAGSEGLRFDSLAEEAKARWLNHAWPGNVRELRNAVERSQALQSDGLGDGFQVAAEGQAQGGGLVPDYGLPFKKAKELLLDRFEKEYLRRLLTRASGGVAGAARQAGLDRKYLYALLDKHGLERPGRKK